jgi:hypothetical protein
LTHLLLHTDPPRPSRGRLPDPVPAAQAAAPNTLTTHPTHLMQVFELFNFVLDVCCALALRKRLAVEALQSSNMCEHDSKPIALHHTSPMAFMQACACSDHGKRLVRLFEQQPSTTLRKTPAALSARGGEACSARISLGSVLHEATVPVLLRHIDLTFDECDDE